MIEVVPFKSSHLEKMTARSVHDGETHVPQEGTLTFTITVDNQPVAILGLFIVQPGIASLWGIVSDSIQRVPIGFTKTVMDLIAGWGDSFKLRRAQVMLRYTYPRYGDWYKLMGFEKEGLLRKFGENGDDYWLYGRVF